MRKVIVRDPVIHLEYTAYFHGFDSTEDSVYAIVEEDSTGVIRVVDVTAVRFLNDPNGKKYNYRG